MGSVTWSSYLEDLIYMINYTHFFDWPICTDPNSTGPKQTAKFWHVILLDDWSAATIFRWFSRAYRVARSDGGRSNLSVSSRRVRTSVLLLLCRLDSEWTSGVGSNGDESCGTFAEPELILNFVWGVLNCRITETLMFCDLQVEWKQIYYCVRRSENNIIVRLLIVSL